VHPQYLRVTQLGPEFFFVHGTVQAGCQEKGRRKKTRDNFLIALFPVAWIFLGLPVTLSGESS
jgi:hypothetical protein